METTQNTPHQGPSISDSVNSTTAPFPANATNSTMEDLNHNPVPIDSNTPMHSYNNSTYNPLSFEITNLDKLQPVHYLILQQFRYVDPLTLMRVSREQYKSVIPLLYKIVNLVNLRDTSVDKFFYGLLNFSTEKDQRGQRKLEAISHIKILGINDSLSANRLIEYCEIFLPSKDEKNTELQGSTPFEKVEHLELGYRVLKGRMRSMLWDEYSSDGEDEDEDDSDSGMILHLKSFVRPF